MEGIVPKLSRRDKQRLLDRARSCREAKLKTRYLIILNLDDGITPTEVGRRLKVSRSTIYRFAERFRECGEGGLVARREANGDLKIDEETLAVLHDVVKASPQDYGWRRPTWTRELLDKILHELAETSVEPEAKRRSCRKVAVPSTPSSSRSRQRLQRRLSRLLHFR